MQPTLPVVFVTGGDALELASLALSGGAIALLRKPFTQQELLDALA
jgi:FixJ family two-component response regulator